MLVQRTAWLVQQGPIDSVTRTRQDRHASVTLLLLLSLAGLVGTSFFSLSFTGAQACLVKDKRPRQVET